jgi:GrpB-like predicted nucleotidyltransferase (UPF0157 family)
MTATVRVIDHDPRWPAEFDIESRRIAAALGDVAERIHHIGSAAIPHIKAKPVIDILLEVASLQALDVQAEGLVALGYETMGEFGIEGRRYFRRNDAEGQRTHQIHAFETGVPNVVRHLAFRDYMRVHPFEAAQYGALKARLARLHPHDVEAYMSGKNAFIKEHERRALEWAGAKLDRSISQNFYSKLKKTGSSHDECSIPRAPENSTSKRPSEIHE